MRIIDADELLKGRTDHEMISTHLIFNAPTVDVLGKIRTEITNLDTIMLNDNPKKVSAYVKLSDVREVIDKYR